MRKVLRSLWDDKREELEVASARVRELENTVLALRENSSRALSDVNQLLAEKDEQLGAARTEIENGLKRIQRLREDASRLAEAKPVLEEALAAEKTRSAELAKASARQEAEAAELKATIDELSVRIADLEAATSGFLISTQDLDLAPLDKFCREAASHPAAGIDHIVVPVATARITQIANMFARFNIQGVSADDVHLTIVAYAEVDRAEIEGYIELTSPTLPRHEVISVEGFCRDAGWTKLGEKLDEVHRSGGIYNLARFIGLYRAICGGARSIAAIEPNVSFFEQPSVLFERLRENFARRLLFASKATIPLMERIVSSSARMFSPYDAARIMSRMEEGRLYSWFFDVPYYPRREAESFLAHLAVLHGGVENAFLKIGWDAFDHVVFSGFLMLHRDFQMVDLRSLIVSENATDAFSVEELELIHSKQEYLPAWAPLWSLLTASEPVEASSKFLLAMHTDRIPA